MANATFWPSGDDVEVLDVVAVVGAPAVDAQARGDVRLGRARRGAVALQQRRRRSRRPRRTDAARHVVLILGNLVADVEDREIDGRRIRVLAAAEADAAAAARVQAASKRRCTATRPQPSRASVIRFAFSIDRFTASSTATRLCIAAQACDVMQSSRLSATSICRQRHSRRSRNAVFLSAVVVRALGRYDAVTRFAVLGREDYLRVRNEMVLSPLGDVEERRQTRLLDGRG